MTPRDRFLSTIRGGPGDRVPLLLFDFHYATFDDVEEPAKRDIVARIIDETHFFHDCPAHINRYLITPPQCLREVARDHTAGALVVTTEIDTPKGKLTAVTTTNATTRTTWTVKYPVESLEDVEKIRSIPWELPEGLATPDPAGFPGDDGHRCVIRTGVSSPFVCVAGMMPYYHFLELCAHELPLMKELTDLCLDRTMRILDVLLENSAIDYVWMGGSEWLTPPMGNPLHYEELVQPYEKKVIDRIHAAGAVCHLHCHGNVRSTLERVIDRGADFLEPVEPLPGGDITFAEAKALADGRITLGGNIEMRLIEHESADVVEHAVREAFEGGKKRMVLVPSAGPIGTTTPRMVENYHRLLDVWEELSRH